MLCFIILKYFKYILWNRRNQRYNFKYLSSCINKYQKVNKQKSPPRIIKSLPSRKIYSMISNENQEEDKNEEDEGMIISPKKKKKKKKKKKRETKTNEVNTVFENKKWIFL